MTLIVTWRLPSSSFTSSHLRAHLKEQLELVELPQKLFVKSVGESIAVAEKMKAEEEQEQEKNRKHRQFLSEFKDTNKMVHGLIERLLH